MTSNNNIKEFRKKLGLSQAELAEKAHIGRNTVMRYEAISFSGRIDAETQTRIAEALEKPQEMIFPVVVKTENGMNRRQLLTSAIGATMLGTILTSPGQSLMSPLSIGKRKLNSTELQTLIEDNHATWMLLDSVQHGTTIDYVNATAHGKLVSLSYLAQSGLPEEQKRLILALFGDMHILLGRIQRDRQNFANAEEHFLTAIKIADEVSNADLKTAALHRYGNMLLLDQSRLVAAERNGRQLLSISKQATFPLWAEAQLLAGMAFAYTGKYEDALRLRDTAQSKQGDEPELWMGNITNPKAIYADFNLITSLAAQKYYDAYSASVDALALIANEQPNAFHWRVNIETMQAQALWGLNDIEGAVATAVECLENARNIENAAAANRLELLYATMLQSKHKRNPAVRHFGEVLLDSAEY